MHFSLLFAVSAVFSFPVVGTGAQLTMFFISTICSVVFSKYLEDLYAVAKMSIASAAVFLLALELSPVSYII